MRALLLLTCITAALSDLTGLLSSAPGTHKDLILPRTEGSLPFWIKGALYRAGPGLFEHGKRSVNGLCDGLAKVHGWSFMGDGTVRYNAAMLPSHMYNRTMKDKVLAPNSVIGDIVPDLSFLEEVEVMTMDSNKKDNTNIAIWNLDGGRSVTVTAESPVMQQMTPHSLKYKGQMISGAVAQLPPYRKALFSASHYAKHQSGTSINYILTMSLLPWELSTASYDFFEYIPTSSGKIGTRKIGSIPQPITDIRILHMMGATENYVVVPLWNYQFSPASLTNVLYDMTHLCHSMRFNYENHFYIYTMSLTTGKLHKFELPPARAVHVMNTFERVNSKGELEVVMDAPTTSDVHEMDLNKNCLFDVMKIPNMKNTEYLYKNVPWNTTLRRYVMNMKTLDYSIVDLPRVWEPVDALVEFPFINPAYWGREYCYCYFQQWIMRTNDMDLMKYDLCTRTAVSWHEDNKHVMEPVYVAHPNSNEEDDGVIIAPVYDSTDSTTELIVWDAKTLTVLARFDNKVKVPFTIHGWWFGEDGTL